MTPVFHAPRLREFQFVATARRMVPAGDFTIERLDVIALAERAASEKEAIKAAQKRVCAAVPGVRWHVAPCAA